MRETAAVRRRPPCPRSARARRVACGLLVVALAACGGGPDPASSPAATAEEIRIERTCRPMDRLGELPAPEQLVDAAALVPALDEMRRTETLPRGHVLLSLAYDADGTNIRREVIEHSVTPAAADSVQKLVFAKRRPAGETEGEWGVRLRLDIDDEVSVGVHPREYCPPRPRDPAFERAIFGARQATGTRYRSGVRERVVLMRLWIHPVGYVAGAEVRQGAAPGSTLERDLTEFLRQYSFHPARIDGAPVRGSIDVPVIVRGS